MKQNLFTEEWLAGHLAKQQGQAPRRPRAVLAGLEAPAQSPLLYGLRYRSKTEARFAQEVLAPQQHAGVITQWLYEPWRLHLAPRTTYTPDFLALVPTGDYVVCYEVKGGWIRDRSTDKLKMAAVKFPWMRFVLAQWKDHEWTYRVIPRA